jgi:hypothetical protein
MVFPDAEWLESICERGGSGRLVHAIPFHAYPETWTPPGITVENYLGAGFDRDFVRSADTACGVKPLWINETGYATTPGRTEIDQARWWVRAAATFVAEPRIEHIGIYEIKDLPTDRPAIGDAPNYHLGLTRTNREKKLAFRTVARLVSMFGASPVVQRDAGASITATPSGADVYRHYFMRRDGRQLLFLWTRRSRAVVNVQLTGRASRVIEYAIDGSPAHGSATDALRNISLEPGDVRFFEIEP